ncbi:hypothetical protein BDM02DRAFT_3194346 [Thelephora ganbajun]|uniref:Uncharacterized protein n=1 Tax=Thelephora ganbajun TaxID=370292 RepID=A0ACB6YXE8_THEGA|nr:hypothetical protein BDM02DRAFT_3194346 [Thelephora ganbajun]
MADNRVLTRRILRLEDRLADLEKKFTSPPREGSSGEEDDPVIPESEPVLIRSAWVGPFKDVPIASLEGRKRRWREWFQRAKEARARRSIEVPVASVVVTDPPSDVVA